jgi:hypothetical protein
MVLGHCFAYLAKKSIKGTGPTENLGKSKNRKANVRMSG